MTRRFLFHPLDTLFFRDGRPFNQDDEGLAAATSLFPPHPSVLVGALRAAIARRHGWLGSGSWTRGDHSQTLKAMLGDGPGDLGPLRFGPPLVLRRQGEGWQRLYPPPLHLLGRKTTGCWALSLLQPSERSRGLVTDLGADALRLPEPRPVVDGAKPVGHHWLSRRGLQAVLRGALPEPRDLLALQPEGRRERRLQGWQGEYRVGLARDPGTRTAVAGQLYAASHVRLGRDTALGIEVEGLDPDWQPQPVATLGGFQRPVAIEEITARSEEAEPPALTRESDGSLRYVVVLTAPAIPPDDGWRTPGAGLAGLPGTIVFACVDRPAMIGGWDGRDRDRSDKWGPRPLVPHLAPGSVWFMEVPPEQAATLAQWQLPAAIGNDASIRQGYGACLIGRWPRGGH